ncbi:hypothetical protein SLE2022_133160 [Rubroshorea leprosula]
MARNVVSDGEDEAEFEDEEPEPEGDAVEDGDEEEEEEEDEEGQDEYENDGFIVDDFEDDEQEEEEEREDSDGERQKKKKRRKKREEERLDEEDYELLRENDVNVTLTKGSKKFKRLKKAQRDSDERFGPSDEEFDGSGKIGRTAEEKVKRSLFGDDEGAPLEDIAEEEERIEEEYADIGDEDEMADFIVDEEEVDEHGDPVRRKKLKRKKSRQAPGVSSSALQEAHEIFGDVDELLLLRKQGLDSAEWRESRLEDEFEPTVLSEKYMTEKDDQIRMADIPERMQLC